MKNLFKLLLVILFSITAQSLISQNWQDIDEGQVININNVELSFITAYIKAVKGQDVYEITATLNNLGSDYITLFPRGQFTFVQTPKNAWTHFKFTNATGKGFSAREGFIYPDPIRMSFPFKCDPEQEKPEYESIIIGVGLNEGEYKTKEWRVRVKRGERVSVKVFNKFN
ncbi:MAG: hypothetical protein GY834_10790 [Bacteroidetes bacterium]|nr:hypothetical protein [Bacteroidota bacterium]